MDDELNADELDLSDAELMTVLRNHGINRRVLMKAFGVGAAVTALGGTAAAKGSPGNRIDEVFGAPYSADDTVPSGIVDHVVELHVDLGDATHEGFPVPDGPDPDDQDDVPEFHFQPVGLHAHPGDVVEFRNVSFEHTITAFHGKFSSPRLDFPTRVPSGVPGFTSPPIVADESWLYRFTTKGVYDVFCFPHLFFGMTMRIVVFDPAEDSLEDSTFDDWGPLPSAPVFGNADKVLTDAALDPSAIVGAGRVDWADLSLP